MFFTNDTMIMVIFVIVYVVVLVVKIRNLFDAKFMNNAFLV